ncbi:hypothetical protein CAEBREN_14966 [Caenorhabditis brenneri]|uniref:Uncharacterized protein n=1 Tax=Caenorhabditis brenneri TaxID=135651 RepID=G0N6N8_CAEBE|nr:hypothetical protein CAEBREN_14966 [Caenorhabditis brenneri]
MRSHSKGLRQNPILYRFLFIFFYMIYVLPKTEKSETTVKVATPFRSVESDRNSQKVCALPDYDIWFEDVKQAMIGYNPMKDCDESFEKWTKLENFTWRIVKDGANCKARIADPPKPIFSNPPNVFIFTIDSMNTGMARRFLPKFLSYFESELKGVEFPFVNKVGENSQPNGFPLWFGKSIETGVIENWKEVKPDWNATEHCATYLDNSTHIFKEFKDLGYTVRQEYFLSHFTINSRHYCLKTGQTQWLIPGHFVKDSKNFRQITSNSCLQWFVRDELRRKRMLLDRPIFSWVWLASLAHSYLDGVARADDYLVEYFKKHQKIFENSFVFFLADHGLRFVEVKTEYMETEIASFERHNPHLAISVPNKIREENPDILSTLRMNSQTLQTHYDTRATLMDILKVTSLIEYGYSKLFKTYKLAVQTNKAHFESMLIYDEEKDEVKFTKVVRLDNYGDTADCTATIRTEPLCHCKDWWSWLSNIYSFSII